MGTIKQLSRIFSDDSSLNRLQDQLASALNPILRNVQGDLSGPLETPTVVALQGRSVSSVAPTSGQALLWNGTQWTPGSVSSGGFITSVLPPLVVSSGVLSIPQANATTDGYLSATDWTTFNGKVGSVTATSPLASSGGTTPDISLSGVVSASHGGTGLSSSGTDSTKFLNSDGAGGWQLATPASGAPSGPAGGVLGYPGSTYPNPNGLAALVGASPSDYLIPIARTGTSYVISIRPDAVPGGGAFVAGQGIELVGGDTGSSGGLGGSVAVRGGAAASAKGGAATFMGGMGSGAYPYYPGGDALLAGGTGAPDVTGKGGDTFVLGGKGSFYGVIANGFGGDVHVAGGVGYNFASGGKVNIGDQSYGGVNSTTEINIGVGGGPSKLTMQGQQFDLTSTPPTTGQALIWDGSKWHPASPVVSAASPRIGNIALVDAVNGNDSTGSINGSPYLTVEAGLAAITAAGTPATLWIMPGTYTLASATTGLTMPTGCAMRGLSTQTTKIVMNASNPGGTVTMLTMGESSRVEDVTLNLNSSNATTNLVGIALPGTSSVTSKFRTGVLTVDNSGLAVGTSTNVTGIYSAGTGTLNDATFSFNFTRGVTINVKSNGIGSKLGIYMPSGVGSANQISTRDTNIYVAAPTDATSTGLYVGIYTDNDNSQVQCRSTSIRGAPYPAVQLKLPVAVTATTNITLSGTYTLQGVALTAGMRVLAAGQTSGTNNGIYIVASGAWTRAGDMAAGSAALGVYAFCNDGTYTHTGWECTTNINVGAGSLTFVQRYVGSDILQNAPQAANGTNGIQLGPGTDLVTKTAATHSFTTYVTPTIALFGLNAGIASSNTGTVRYCWPGTLASTGDTAQVFSRVQQKSVMQGMFINLRTAPGGSNSVQVTVLASKTGVVGSGVPTLMSATISGSATSATNYSTSVDFAQFDYFSVQVTGFGNSNSAADLVVQLDLF